MFRVFLSWALLMAPPAVAAAQDPEPLPIKPVALEVSANKPPARALKVHFLPEVREQTAGNAASLWEKAHGPLKKINRDLGGPRLEAVDNWRGLPLKDFPVKEAREHLKLYEGVLADAEKASRCAYCDWGLADRLRKDGLGALLPEVQEMRELARLLALKARVEMAEGNPEAAARTLMVGFVSARHVGEQPTLINALVGNAICHVMIGEVEKLLQLPDCPNLYWALTDLPAPLISLRVPLQGDRLMGAAVVPGLEPSATDPRGGPMSEEDARKAMEALPRLVRDIRPGRPLPAPLAQRHLALKIAGQHEVAKKKLLEQGRPADLVERMPHVQVALLYALGEYDDWYEEFLKLHNLPYHRIADQMERLDRAAKARRANPPPDAPVLPLGPELLPGVHKVFLSCHRLERKVAALRVVEAVRLHAAEHGGEPPASLADLKAVPVPTDPGTGGPFEYRRDGATAEVKAAPLKAEPVNQGTTVWYAVTIRK